MSDLEPFAHWAILNLFGHQRLAGRVTQAPVGGGHLLQVDVPSVHGSPSFTRLIGVTSIYDLTIVEEAVALAALATIKPAPIEVYLLPRGAQQLAMQWLDKTADEQDEAPY